MTDWYGDIVGNIKYHKWGNHATTWISGQKNLLEYWTIIWRFGKIYTDLSIIGVYLNVLSFKVDFAYHVILLLRLNARTRNKSQCLLYFNSFIFNSAVMPKVHQIWITNF